MIRSRVASNESTLTARAPHGAGGGYNLSTRRSRCGALPWVALFAILGQCFATDTLRTITKKAGSEPFFQIHYGQKWGYMDRNGSTVIPPEFDDEGDFFEGLARVERDGKWGFVNHTGRMAIPFKFDDAGDFSEGLAPVRLGRKWGFVDPTGELVIKPQFQGAGEFSGGLALFETWSTIQCGKSHFSEETAPAYAFRLHRGAPAITGACYSSSIRYGFVDKRGNVAVAPKFKVATDFCEGVAAVQVGPNTEYGYIDRSGAMVVPPQFDEADSFSEGLAAVEVGGRIENGEKIEGLWGFIRHNGSFAVSPRFRSAHGFAEGLAAVSRTGTRWGYIDKRGVFTVAPAFLEANEFSDGLALVWSAVSPDNEEGDRFYIDKSGRKALLLKLPAISSFSDGLAIAGAIGQRKYVDHRGRVVAAYEVDPR
jgi:hypothetical protein